VTYAYEVTTDARSLQQCTCVYAYVVYL
jgi:hypothetical protein